MGVVVAKAEESDFPSLGSAGYTLGLLFVAYVFSFIDRQILSLLVGPIRADFDITDFQFSLLQGAAFALLYTVAGLPLGRLADRFSRRMIIAGSVFFWSLTTCLCGAAKNFSQLFIARMGVGAGEAGLAPPAYSIITDSFRPEHFGYAMAIYKVGVKVGAGLALVVGGFLIDYYSQFEHIEIPLLGAVAPWQATIVSVGAPGFLLALLLMTIKEPTRKGLVSLNSETKPLSLPIKTVANFLWQRKRLYLSLFVGSSCLAMAGYGNGAWYPEFLYRNYGMSKSEAGGSYGTILLTAGTLGVLIGPWVAQQLLKRGYKDGYVRTIFFASIISFFPAVAAPLAGSAKATLLLLWPAVFFGSAYLGVMAASFQPITPNQMRGQTTAIYIFVTNIMGMAVGTSILAAFTDFVYQDDGMLHYSIATVNAIFYPLAALCFWYCLPAYRHSLTEVGHWRLTH